MCASSSLWQSNYLQAQHIPKHGIKATSQAGRNMQYMKNKGEHRIQTHHHMKYFVNQAHDGHKSQIF
jgi:hypothetical protein